MNSIKDNVTAYSKPVPNFTHEDVIANKEKVMEAKDEQKLMEEGKFREYAIEYW